MSSNFQDELGTIVLDGFYGRKNAGDEAILAAILQQIRSYDPNAKVIVSTFNQEYTAKTHNVDKTIPRYDPSTGIPSSEWLVAIKEADQLWIGGGGLFGKLKMLKYAVAVAIARASGTRVATIAVGSGPIKSDPLRITASTLDHADALTVRDFQSKQYLQTTGVTTAIDVVADPVFAYNPDPSISLPAPVSQLKSDRILVVSVRKPNSYELNEKEFATALDESVDELDCRIVFLPFHDEPVPDSKVATRIADQMTSEAIVCEKSLSFRELFAVIKGAHLVVDMRLHSIIFAARAGTPFVGIPYAPKCEANLERLQAKQTFWCNSINAENLKEEIITRWAQGFSTSTEKAIETLEEKADDTIRIIQSREQAASQLLLPRLVGTIAITGMSKFSRRAWQSIH